MGIDIPNFWDKNAISPGTKFMHSIYERIEEINKGALEADSGNNRKIIFSSAYEPGEGEHKILDYIRKGEENGIDSQDNLIIYGLDADLYYVRLWLAKEIIYIFLEKP